jgi:hypothetical protein
MSRCPKLTATDIVDRSSKGQTVKPAAGTRLQWVQSAPAGPAESDGMDRQACTNVTCSSSESDDAYMYILSPFLFNIILGSF